MKKQKRQKKSVNLEGKIAFPYLAFFLAKTLNQIKEEGGERNKAVLAHQLHLSSRTLDGVLTGQQTSLYSYLIVINYIASYVHNWSMPKRFKFILRLWVVCIIDMERNLPIMVKKHAKKKK